MKMWDMSDRLEVMMFAEESQASSICTSPANELVVIGSKNEHVRIINWISGTTEFKSGTPSQSLVSCVAFSGRGAYLAAGCEDYAMIWDTSTWAVVGTAKTPCAINHISFHQMEKTVAMGSIAGAAVSFWDWGSENAEMLSSPSEVNRVAFQNDGAEIAIGSNDSIVRIWEYDLLSSSDFGFD